ncbi:MAG TPA: TIGR03086 family metal-binding protein [Acidothermaceae bacterium]|nr:TIGR03086 family metal-binding protein [Acidothermaceae bacterium]
MADTAELEDVLHTTGAIVAGVKPDQYGSPTPCPGYDVATLVNHIVAWITVFADGASQESSKTNPATYQVGSDPAAEYDAAAKRLVAAFRDGAADRDIDLGNGPSPGSMILGMILMEDIGHGWDLAMATDQSAPYSERSIKAAKAAAQANLKPEYRGPDKSFGEIVVVADDAPPLDELIGLLGRDPAQASR